MITSGTRCRAEPVARRWTPQERDATARTSLDEFRQRRDAVAITRPQ
jgi:hypothetical protein